MPIYIYVYILEDSDNYLKTSGIYWQYCRDKTGVDASGGLIDANDFNSTNATTNSFNLKVKITGETGGNGRKNIKLMAPSKYLDNVIYGELLKCL